MLTTVPLWAFNVRHNVLHCKSTSIANYSTFVKNSFMTAILCHMNYQTQ